MIKRLHIRNYAIIELLDIDFAKGLTIITGETGAGKSILLGALGLIMGDRADTKSLYNQEEKCVIEGVFDLNGHDLNEFFSEHDLDYETEVVVRRELTPSGKSRAFVNDSPVTLRVLQDLSAELIDLHQQFDTLDIHNLSFQLRMIDALAGNKERLIQYRKLYKDYSEKQRRLEELLRRNEQSTKEMEFIQFQLEEFNKAEWSAGEQEALEEELTRLTHAEDIKRTLSFAFDALTENEQSIVGQMHSLGNALVSIGKYAPKLGEYSDRFANMIFELREMSNEFEKIADQTDHDPERILEAQQRLDLIYRLQKKHIVATVDDLLNIQSNLEQQLAGFADLGNEIGELRHKIAEQETHLFQMADDLADRRQAVIPTYEDKIVEMLGQLAMPYAQLKIETRKLDALGPTGLDEVQFMFAANRGSRLQQIKDVASGGELSRLALVTKSLVASSIPLPTLIFDEIDAGISGDVALKMGNILRNLSNEHQVVTITHSPQVASKADRHYFVFKVDKPERTVTNVRLLSNEDRIRAIAVMLSQSPPSDSAMENARELLGL